MSDYSPPTESAGDHGHTLVRAGIGALPLISGPAVELFQMLVGPPIERRRFEWMQRIATGLEALEAKQKCIVDDLKANDAFIDTVMQASQAALRTSQQEKLEALRNAVLNSALPSAPDDTRRQLFINWVDTLTVWHLRMLKLFADPTAWYAANDKPFPQFVSNYEAVLLGAFPGLKDERPLYDKLTKDLHQDGLLTIDGLRSMMSNSGPRQGRASELGQQLLAFITDPVA